MFRALLCQSSTARKYVVDFHISLFVLGLLYVEGRLEWCADCRLKQVSTKLKLNSVALVRERTIPTERPPPVGEVSANFCG